MKPTTRDIAFIAGAIMIALSGSALAVEGTPQQQLEVGLATAESTADSTCPNTPANKLIHETATNVRQKFSAVAAEDSVALKYSTDLILSALKICYCDSVWSLLHIGVEEGEFIDKNKRFPGSGSCADLHSLKTAFGDQDQWVWDDGSGRYVYFDNGRLTAIQQ